MDKIERALGVKWPDPAVTVSLGESDGKKENMKKQYTKKQITEAIARWKRTLRRMNEDGEV